MARTNINLDYDVRASVMRQYGLRTKQEAVNQALYITAIEPMSLEEALAMQGSGWEGNLDEMRATRYP